MIIDSHTHIGSLGGKKYTAQDLLKSMKEAGIDSSFVIALPDKSQPTIEELIKSVSGYPQLKIIGNISYLNFSEKVFLKTKRLIKKKLIIGLKFYLGYEGFYPSDKKLHPIYEFCSKEGIPVVFHTGALLKGERGMLKYSHPLNIDELATLFPKLKIIMAHFGNPWINDCVVVVAKNPNVYVDFSGYFSEFVKISNKERKMFVENLTRFKIFVGDFSKCLFGTDWPIYSQKEYLKAVLSLPMTKEEKELVLWKNAANLYKT